MFCRWQSQRLRRVLMDSFFLRVSLLFWVVIEFAISHISPLLSLCSFFCFHLPLLTPHSPYSLLCIYFSLGIVFAPCVYYAERQIFDDTRKKWVNSDGTIRYTVCYFQTQSLVVRVACVCECVSCRRHMCACVACACVRVCVCQYNILAVRTRIYLMHYGGV